MLDPIEISREEMERVVRWSMKRADSTNTSYNSTYEEGIRDALEWVLGNGDDPSGEE